MNETTIAKATPAQLQQSRPAATPNPTDLLQMAVQQGFDLDRLQRIIDMQNQWEQKQAKKAFLAALSRFQSLVPVLKKTKTANVPTRTGGQFSYKYADLGSISQAIKKPLEECGLSYRWQFAEKNGKMEVTCHVSHIDGHTESVTMEAGADNSGAKNDIQQKGSTQTYLQRYTLIGALGLATADEDNDAGSRQQPKQQQKAHPQQQQQPSEDEILDQWKQALTDKKTQAHLTAFYLQNKKVVDENPKLKELFKSRENEIKAAIGNTKTAMP